MLSFFRWYGGFDWESDYEATPEKKQGPCPQHRPRLGSIPAAPPVPGPMSPLLPPSPQPLSSSSISFHAPSSQPLSSSSISFHAPSSQPLSSSPVSPLRAPSPQPQSSTQTYFNLNLQSGEVWKRSNPLHWEALLLFYHLAAG